MPNPPSAALLQRLADRLGPKGFSRDPAELAPWLTDWRGRYTGRAAALLSPARTEEVVAVVRACAEEKVALVPQGGNTSMVGGATPDREGHALLLSLRRMNRIRMVDPQGLLAVCEAGVVLSDLHAAACEAGARFPLSLGARGSATVGGLVSTNAGGTQVLRFGTMRALVAGVEAVLPDGSLFEGLAALSKENQGYSIAQLLIGAEGTLGVVTAASLRLVPPAGARAVAWAGLASPDQGLALLRRLERDSTMAIESFELVPAAALDLVLTHIPGARAPLATPAPWNALIEATDSRMPPLADALARALDDKLLIDAAVAATDTQANALWALRDSISEAERRDGEAAKHDISVPVAAMPAFICETGQAVEARFPGTRVNAFGHLGDGNVHFNVRAPADAEANWLAAAAPAITQFVHDRVVAAGGAISAEHGIGQMRLSELARLAPAARLSAMRAIKQALDPCGIMNPGKLVPLAKSPPRP